MQDMKLLSACTLALLLVGGGTTLALAQEADSGEPNDVILGQSVVGFGTDVWALLCLAPSTQALVTVFDVGGIDGRRFHLCVVNASGAPGACGTVPDGGNATLRSVGGVGSYNVTVFWSPPIAGVLEPYNLNIRCTNAALTITPHVHFLIQNQ
jgi:hypothetical protein